MNSSFFLKKKILDTRNHILDCGLQLSFLDFVGKTILKSLRARQWYLLELPHLSWVTFPWY